jgi:HD-GYP domain-containing protein (c-di-GMP phosphodiesterase class II)
LLHDIGKIGVSSSILDKNGKLTKEEFALIQKHPGIGAEILRPIKAYAEILPIIEQHHEKYDGTGYPFGLSGTHIHPLARIVAVADTFDAMVSDRPYRLGFTMEKALQIIRSEAGRQFDPAVVDTLFKLEGWLHADHSFDESGTFSMKGAGDRLALMSSTLADGGLPMMCERI